MKRHILTSLVLTIISIVCHAQNDGPYIIYQEDGSARIITVDADAKVHDQISTMTTPGTVFNVKSNDGRYSFDVTLHANARPAWKHSKSDKIFVMSDPHGNLDCVISLLQGNGVIDNDLHWSFGTNHLAILGDIFDRGPDVTQIFWLVYQLEAEASAAGGCLSFIYGNHEPMVLSGDLRYTDEKYKSLASQLGMEFQELMGPQTELGRWLSTRNTMMLIGDNLFVHAGLSQDFLDKGLSIPEVNEIMSHGLFLTKAQRKEDSELMNFLFTTYGPIWYRGLVFKKATYFPASRQTVDDFLDKYGAKRLFVGHTIFRNVKSFYKGKVIDVNVSNQLNKDKGRSRGVLISGNETFTVGDKGIKSRIR